jgi:predicted ATPase
VEVDVLDLGAHRLKDFLEPEVIFQLGRESFPPLRTISNTNLPRPASSLVGRGREIAEVVSLVGAGARLITLSGPGGSGKTRLALASGAELVSEFRDGVFWVDLAPVREPSLVTRTIAEVVGAKEELASFFGERELLLVLDNFEQVVEAASDLAELLRRCVNLVLVVTSRELLRIHGEVEYRVPPLRGPEAVELFCARGQVAPDEIVPVLCRRLDDLPLAVELAAARTAVLSPRQILDRLSERLDLLRGGRDAEARQRTLRATIGWSYELLSTGEQSLFERLSVFVGGFTLDAAAEICDAGVDGLQSLTDKSLLQCQQERFTMLETIREYALERLEQANPTPWRVRHAEYFATQAEAAGLDARPPDQNEWLERADHPEWLDRLEQEQGNWRAALEFTETNGLLELQLRLVAALAPFWSFRGHYREGGARLAEALRATGDIPPGLQARLLGQAAWIAMRLGQLDDAIAFALKRRALAAQLDDPMALISATIQLGFAEALTGDLDSAQDHLGNAVAGAEELDGSVLATARLNLGFISLMRGEPSAEGLLEQAVDESRAAGRLMLLSGALTGLATAQRLYGHLEPARASLLEAIQLQSAARNPEYVSDQLIEAAGLLGAAGRDREAARMLGAADELVRRIELSSGGWFIRLRDDIAVVIEDRLGQDDFQGAIREGAKFELDAAIAAAIELLGELAPRSTR